MIELQLKQMNAQTTYPSNCGQIIFKVKHTEFEGKKTLAFVFWTQQHKKYYKCDTKGACNGL